MRLDELAKEIGAELVGDGSVEVSSVSTLEDAQAGQVSFLSNARYAKLLDTTKASAVIVAPKTRAAGPGVAMLRAADPYFAFQKAMVKLHGHRKHPFNGVHPQAFVDPTATIGEGTTIYAGAFVGPGAKIGRDCILYPNVAVYDGCVLGDRVILQANVIIGADGYGYATNGGVHHKIPQAGNVIIEDDVEIGANSCVDRAALGSTLVGKGTKIDDLVMIGHSVKIGPGCLIVAQVGIAGSCEIGKYVVMAGQVGVAGHLNIGDKVTIGAKSGVISDIPEGQTVLGMPAMPARHSRRVYSIFTQLPELLERIKTLEQQVENLTMTGGDEGVEVV
jgi:UDP-3-O-[3-hydroxymyristoyl] glucosamine N-acyltransferase